MSKIIHFIWLGPAPIPMEFIQTWIDIHDAQPFDYKNAVVDNDTVKLVENATDQPTENANSWKYKIWREKDIDELEMINRAHYEAAKGKFNQMADIARLEILYNYGGIYIDVDIVCLKSLDCLIESNIEEKTLFVQEKTGVVSNSFIISQKYSPVMLYLIGALGLKIINTNASGDNVAVWQLTGPKLITDHIEFMAGSIIILPHYYVNIMMDLLYACRGKSPEIFNKPDEFKKLFDKTRNKDIQYIKTNRCTIDKNNIYGVQLWCGGKLNNYEKNRQINMKNLLKRIYEYIDWTNEKL